MDEGADIVGMARCAIGNPIGPWMPHILRTNPSALRTPRRLKGKSLIANLRRLYASLGWLCDERLKNKRRLSSISILLHFFFVDEFAVVEHVLSMTIFTYFSIIIIGLGW